MAQNCAIEERLSEKEKERNMRESIRKKESAEVVD
jgi:hypothetical protein